MARDMGDFQTPPALVKVILDWLQTRRKKWTRALEPTCGQGNFIAGLLSLAEPPAEIIGLELQQPYVEKARQLSATPASCVTISQQNIFDLNLQRLDWKSGGPLLVVGNPPWVTNTELGVLDSSNLPRKSNLKKLAGIEALTGSSNFDIAEYIWLKLIRELSGEPATIALLCKTAVARNVLQFAASVNLPVGNAAVIKLDAKKWFGAATDACLFCLDIVLERSQRQYEAPVFADFTNEVPCSIMGFIGGQLVTNIQRHSSLNRLDGISPLMWRQGIKHDVAAVVELTVDSSGQLYNKLGELVEVESEYIYPFLKSSDLAGRGKPKPKRAVIVPQKQIGQATSQLAHIAPRLWAYLSRHQAAFAKRKSSIYRNQPAFSYFGIGDYSFTSFKVAISGMYKTPLFRVLVPENERAVMVDDTCYFLPCYSILQAALTACLLNNPQCLDLLNSIIFWDAKRPITKKLLQRLDLLALLELEDRRKLIEQVSEVLIGFRGAVSLEEINRSLEILRTATSAQLEAVIRGQSQIEIPSQLALPGFANR
jgi:hypothetical protein